MSNVSIIEFDPNPEKIWSLLDKIIGASAAEAYNCIHVIEIDIFSQARYDLMVNWWCRFAETLLRYKQANKGRRVCWIMDEFQRFPFPQDLDENSLRSMLKPRQSSVTQLVNIENTRFD
jgi:hypothetical protein